MAVTPKTIIVTNPKLANRIITAGQRLIELGMRLRDNGAEVRVQAVKR